MCSFGISSMVKQECLYGPYSLDPLPTPSPTHALSRPVNREDDADTLMDAVRADDIPKVRELIKSIPVNIQAKKRDHRGNNATALTTAVVCELPEMVRFLVENGADVALPGEYNETALFKTGLFFEKNSLQIAKILIQNGALEKEIQNGALEKEDQLPLFLNELVRRENIELLNLLFDNGVNVNTRYQGQTLYTTALENNYRGVLRLLKSRGADPWLGRNLSLHPVISKGVDAVSKVLENPQIDIDQQDVDGSTPLHAALMEGNDDVVRLLLKKGAKTTIVDNREVSALFLAIFLKKDHLVDDIISAGADIHQKNSSGWDALWVAAQQGGVVTFQKLLKLGANPCNYARNGYSLHTMLKTYRPKFQKQLKKALREHVGESAYKEMKVYSKAVTSFKNYGHATHYETRRKINGHEVVSTFGQPEYAARSLAKLFRSFKESYPTLLDDDIYQELQCALNFTADQNAFSAKHILQRIQRNPNVPTMLNTGWNQHNVSVMFYKEYFIVCNTGPSGQGNIWGDNIIPLRVFRYDRSLLNEETIQLLLDARYSLDNFKELYCYVMYSVLPQKLQLQEIPWDHHQMPVLPQTTNNCSWLPTQQLIGVYLSLNNVPSDIYADMYNTLIEWSKKLGVPVSSNKAPSDIYSIFIEYTKKQLKEQMQDALAGFSF